MQPQTEWLNSKEELSFSVKPLVAKHGLDYERRKLDETGSALFHKRLMKRYILGFLYGLLPSAFSAIHIVIVKLQLSCRHLPIQPVGRVLSLCAS